MKEWWLLIILIGLTVFASIMFVYPFKRRLFMGFLLIPFVFLMAFTGYFYWGNFFELQQHFQRLDSQEQAQKVLQSIKTPEELIVKLKAKLDNSPKSAKGWYLLGRLYTSQNDTLNAVKAFQKAYQFKPDEEQFAINYAHSLWVINNQKFTEQITDIFSRLLKNNPNQPDALAMLAMDAFISHAYEDAITYWKRLLILAPPQSEEAQAIRKAIVKAEEHIRLRDKS